MKLLRWLALAAATIILPLSPAHSQAPPQPMNPAVFAGYAIIAATSVSGRVALPADTTVYVALTVYNSGTKDVFFAVGTSSITATTSSSKLSAGTRITFWIVPGNTHVAAITSGVDQTNLQIYQSNGLLEFGAAGGGAGGGGAPGGTNGMVQYNSNDTFGGITGWTTNGTTALTGGASTTLTLNGATIGTNVISAVGQGLISGATTTSPGWYAQLTGDTVPRVRVGLNASDVGSIAFGSGSGTRDLFIERLGAASFRFGTADAAAPIAQTMSVQGVVAGTTDTAGALWTFNASQGTGNGASGGFTFQTAPAGTASASTQNALENTLVIASVASSFSPRGTLTLRPNTPVQAATATAGFAVTIAASAGTAGSGAGAAAGGALTISSGAGVRNTSGNGAGGALTISTGAGIGTVSSGALALSTGSGGGNITVTAGNGGNGSTTGSTTPGNVSITAGTGGNSIGGGTMATLSGVGGISSTTGGAGGASSMTTGAGAASSGSVGINGGAGGAIALLTGTGGDTPNAASGTNTAGNSGAIAITTGPGGTNTGGAGTRNGGNSGNITLAIGAAGTGASANGTVGSISFSHAGTVTNIFTSGGLYVLGATAANTVPALKPSGTAVQFRLGDDSGFTSFTATTGILNNLASDATHTDATVCVDTVSGLLYKGSGTIGICLGTSSARYKQDIAPMDGGSGLDRIVALEPRNYRYRYGYGDPGKKQYGFIAEEVVNVLPDLVGLDRDGRPNSVDMLGMLPVMVAAMKELRAENEALRKRIDDMPRFSIVKKDDARFALPITQSTLISP